MANELFNPEEKQFTSVNMIEFARWFSDSDIDESDLTNYVGVCKENEAEEYQKYLKLKEKYEKPSATLRDTSHK